MPFYKTTYNIFSDGGEYFEPNWMDSNKIIYPPNKKWDYKRELQIEDVNLWETVAENACGVYVSYDPYAEFYLIIDFNDKTKFKTYYGPKAQQKVIKKMKELKIDIPFRKIWVDPEDMWLY